VAQTLKIKKGDTVEVLAGKDRGKRGRVLEARPDEGRVLVEGRNIAKKHSRPRPVKGTRGAQMTPGGVIDIEAPIRIDNVGLVCQSCDAVTRVGYRFLANGDKVRFCKKCDSQIDTGK
jgi:large subunit ribosomal protein L24